jgi:hypothetical protein
VVGLARGLALLGVFEVVKAIEEGGDANDGGGAGLGLEVGEDEVALVGKLAEGSAGNSKGGLVPFVELGDCGSGVGAAEGGSRRALVARGFEDELPTFFLVGVGVPAPAEGGPDVRVDADGAEEFERASRDFFEDGVARGNDIRRESLPVGGGGRTIYEAGSWVNGVDGGLFRAFRWGAQRLSF